MKNFYIKSLLFLVMSILTFSSKAQCDGTLTMNDSYGDGWNGGVLTIYANGMIVAEGSLGAGASGTEIFPMNQCDAITAEWTVAGSWASERSWSITDGAGNVIASGDGTTGTAEVVAYCSDPGDACLHQVLMNDSYGDGWNGGVLTISVNGSPVADASLGAGASGTVDFSATTCDVISAAWTTAGSWASERSYSILDGEGNVIFSGDGTTGGQGAAYCAPPATNPPVADFSASSTSVNLGVGVTFTDLSTESPTSWTWSFDPSTVTYISGSSTSQNPVVSFDAPGVYDVTLIAANAAADDIEMKTSYITASCQAMTVNYPDDYEQCAGGSSTLVGTVIDPNQPQLYKLTSSGGSYAAEKWMNITTGVDGSGTVVWAQGNGTIGNGAGLVTNVEINLSNYTGQTL